MTPPARVQAAIDLLDLIITSTRDQGPAADRILATWFKARRFVGSKDRRAISALVYRAIRHFGQPPTSGRAAFLAFDDLRGLFDGSNYGPAVPAEGEEPAQDVGLADWLAAKIRPEEQAALQARAPLDLRANALKIHRDALIAQLPGAEPIAGTRNGIRLAENIHLPAELDGLVEVQDAGSQMIAEACAVLPGETIVDLCAGAGGKTLALAAEMAENGRIIACDTDRRRLSQLPIRAEKAGAARIEQRLLNPGREMEALADLASSADAVLVDAPCSGTGTWRRNPELRWRLSPSRLAQTLKIQAQLLDLAAVLVRPGGRMVYAVCSLLDEEGKGQISNWLLRNPGWSMTADKSLSPARDRTDGFYFAILAKPC